MFWGNILLHSEEIFIGGRYFAWNTIIWMFWGNLNVLKNEENTIHCVLQCSFMKYHHSNWEAIYIQQWELDEIFFRGTLLCTLVFVLSWSELMLLMKTALGKIWKISLALKSLATLLKSEFFKNIAFLSNTFDTVYMYIFKEKLINFSVSATAW